MSVDPESERLLRRAHDAADGRIAVDVHQVARDTAANLLAGTAVVHVYALSDGLVMRMDVG